MKTNIGIKFLAIVLSALFFYSCEKTEIDYDDDTPPIIVYALVNTQGDILEIDTADVVNNMIWIDNPSEKLEIVVGMIDVESGVSRVYGDKKANYWCSSSFEMNTVEYDNFDEEFSLPNGGATLTRRQVFLKIEPDELDCGTANLAKTEWHFYITATNYAGHSVYRRLIVRQS